MQLQIIIRISNAILAPSNVLCGLSLIKVVTFYFANPIHQIVSLLCLGHELVSLLLPSVIIVAICIHYVLQHNRLPQNLVA
jgi:hypothetical protein